MIPFSVFALGDILIENHSIAKDQNTVPKTYATSKGGGLLNALYNFQSYPVKIFLGTQVPDSEKSLLEFCSFLKALPHKDFEIIFLDRFPLDKIHSRLFVHKDYETQVSTGPILKPEKSSLKYFYLPKIDLLYLYDHNLDLWTSSNLADLNLYLDGVEIPYIFIDSRKPDLFIQKILPFLNLHKKSFIFWKMNEKELSDFSNLSTLKDFPFFFILNSLGKQGSILWKTSLKNDDVILQNIVSTRSFDRSVFSPNNIGCGDSFSAHFIASFISLRFSFIDSLKMANIAGNIQASQSHQMLPPVSIDEILLSLLNKY